MQQLITYTQHTIYKFRLSTLSLDFFGKTRGYAHRLTRVWPYVSDYLLISLPAAQIISLSETLKSVCPRGESTIFPPLISKFVPTRAGELSGFDP